MTGAEANLYHYRAHCTKVYDGDTVTVDIDLGFGIIQHDVTLRLHAINTPELRGVERPLGLEVRDHLRTLVLDRDLIVRTYLKNGRDRTGKYGRLLAVLMLDELNVNQHLLKTGRAQVATYGDDTPFWAIEYA